jgi:hypothetical protein
MNFNQHPVSRNKLQNNMQSTHQKSETPVDDSHNIAYGLITAVNNDTSQVKVKLYTTDSTFASDEILNGAYLPLLNPLIQIQHEWGAIRVGLLVRVHWKGKLNQKNAVIEIVGDEESPFLNKEPLQNELPTGPFRIFSAGL